MPYISVEARARLERSLGRPTLDTAGELNYCITRLIERYRERLGTNYQTLNDILGALEGAKQEFYRRVVEPYENTKLALNGDVYGHEPSDRR